MADDPYSRVYWRLMDEFPEVWDDDHALATWLRLLVAHDQAWPTAGTIPVGTRQGIVDRLVAIDLVKLISSKRLKVRGLDKHRQSRSDAARNAVAKRWQYARNTEAIPSRAEPSRDKPSPVIRMTDEEQREQLDKLGEVMRASGLVPAPKLASVKAEPATDTEVIDHLRTVMDDDEAPQWKREAAKAQLEAMRSL